MPATTSLSRRRPAALPDRAPPRSKRATLRVALVGVDVSGSAPGGMASISRTLLQQFAQRDGVELVPITNFDEGSLLRRLYVGWKAAFRIATYRGRLDLIHLQVADGWSIERDLVSVLVAKIRRIPVVAQFHGAGQVADYENGNPVHRFEYRVLTRTCYNLALGDSVFNWLAMLGCSDHSETVTNGVAIPDEITPLSDGVPRLAFVGRLGQRKGIFDLLQAAETVARYGVDFHLDVVGDGEIDKVKDRVRATPLLADRVSVHGWVPAETVRQIMLESRALLLPSYAEGLPMAILEAMALARPVIATTVGEISLAVQNRVNGLLVDPGDVGALAHAMADLLTDREEATRLGDEGRSMAIEAFSESALADKLEMIYRNLSAGRERNAE